MKFLIPKEIKSKAKIFGMWLKDLVILLLGFFLILSVFSDMVHSSLVILFDIVAGGFLFWMVMPSINNRGKQNYESLFLLSKRNRLTYHPIDINESVNEILLDEEGR